MGNHIDCRKCAVHHFKHSLCEGDFCQKHAFIGDDEDFIRQLLPHTDPQPECNITFTEAIEAMHGMARAARKYNDKKAEVIAELAAKAIDYYWTAQAFLELE